MSKKSQKKVKEVLSWLVPLVAVIALVVWIATLPKKPGTDVVSRQGIHAHPQILITINGEPQTISGGIGLGGVHSDIHTHDPDNVLHVEKSGVVREANITVGNFFKIWRKDFSSTSILGNENSEDGVVTMFVNGVPNDLFDKYQMQDGDVIEILFGPVGTLPAEEEVKESEQEEEREESSQE